MDTMVYCLFHGSYDDRNLCEVYATLELAQEAASTPGAEDAHEWTLFVDEPSRRLWSCAYNPEGRAFGCEYTIEEHTLVRQPAVAHV